VNRAIFLVLAVLVLSLAGPRGAHASATVTNITINGGSTANVAPGDTLTISITVVLTSGSRWRSTGLYTSPGSSLNYCSLAPDISSSGTWTRVFSIPAPSGSGIYSLNVQAWSNPNCNGTTSPTKTLPGGINTGPATLSLNHVRIVHDGSALTCSPETVTLKACANASCSTLFTDPVTVSLGASGSWSSNPATISNGTAALTLSNSIATTATLSGTVTSPTASNTAAVCYKGSTANDCTLSFTNGSCSLDAVEVGKNPNTSIFTKRIGGGTLTLDVLALNNGVLNPSSTQTVNAQLVVGSGGGCSTTALSPVVSFTFNGTNQGRRPITFVPNAAARDARVRMVSGSLIQCSSDNFAIRPTAFTVTASGAGADNAGLSTSNTPVLKAGSGTFGLNASTSVGYTGTPLTAAQLVQAHVNPDPLKPANAVGTLSGTFGAGNGANPSIASGNAFTYSEVGYFRLPPYAVYDDGSFADVDGAKASPECFESADLGSDTTPADPNLVAADGRLGCYFGNTATSNYFGRFIPDHFALSAVTVTNRSALTACTAPVSTFSYFGETITPTFTLTAENAAGNTTTNYRDSFARLVLSSQLFPGAVNDPAAPAVRTLYPVCGATPAHPCITLGTVAGGTMVDGEAADITLPLTVFRGASAAAPAASFKIGIAPVDADQVKLAAYDIDTSNVTAGAPNHGLLGSTIVRYGRMNVDNAYGSELLNLTMPVTAQYWSGLGWATNLLDSCTPLSPANFSLSSQISGITALNMNITNLSASGTLTAGTGKVTLAKPSPVPASKGSAKVNSTLPYLPGSGRATFGVYKSGPVIHVRETY
jgi:hypothetical protein